DAAQRQLEIDGRRGMDAVEKESEQQELAVETEAKKAEARVAAADAAEQKAQDQRREAGEQAMAAMNTNLQGDLESVETMDLTVAKQAAEQLREAMDHWRTDRKGVYDALSGKSPAEMRAIKAAYKARTGHELDVDLDHSLSDAELRKAKALE